MIFVFRNNTIEPFFPKTFSFSGYDDISNIPQEVEGYIWFYQSPMQYNQKVAAEEISSFPKKLLYVLDQIDTAKPIFALTMVDFLSVPFSEKDRSVREAVNEYNQVLFELEKRYPNVKVINIEDFTRNHPKSDLFDWKYYFISQMGMNPKLSREFAEWWKKKMDGIALKRKKCIVLDLDNTLWGGILGEDGPNGIKLNGDYPGNAFYAFQNALLNLSNAGIILTICSKNNEQDVLDAWDTNPNIVIGKNSIAAYRINWNDKPSNIREISEELNIGLDSMVFIDDNPSERELVKEILPEVTVPEFPEHPYDLLPFFEKLVNDYFKVYQITEEDRNKTIQYRTNIERKKFWDSYSSYAQYLVDLKLKLRIMTVDESNIARIAQLTQKTNQFNLTTKRYTENDIRKQLSAGWNIWCISVSDRFGDNGITGCIFYNGSTIDSLMLSCRILGKGIENAFLKYTLSFVKQLGINTVKAYYLPTPKNELVKDFYEKCGFMLIKEDSDAKSYSIDLSSADLRIDDCYEII